jgi:hypothetical protein
MPRSTPIPSTQSPGTKHQGSGGEETSDEAAAQIGLERQAVRKAPSSSTRESSLSLPALTTGEPTVLRSTEQGFRLVGAARMMAPPRSFRGGEHQVRPRGDHAERVLRLGIRAGRATSSSRAKSS